MMAYGIMLIAILGLLGGGMWKIHSSGVEEGRTACREEQQKAYDKMKQELDAAKAEAENKIIDMTAAYDAGAAKSRIIYRTIETKAIADVQKLPMFRTPDCAIGPDQLRDLNLARAQMRALLGPGPVADSMRATRSDH